VVFVIFGLDRTLLNLTYIPTYLPTYILTYLPTYLPTCLGVRDYDGVALAAQRRNVGSIKRRENMLCFCVAVCILVTIVVMGELHVNAFSCSTRPKLFVFGGQEEPSSSFTAKCGR